jgi:hypothetical protein
VTKFNLPRYFVSRSDSKPISLAAREFIPLHALDNFFAGGRHLQEEEWLVATDAAGNLRALSGDDLDKIPAEVQSQVAFSEVALEGRMRLIETVDFCLFNVQLLEQATGAPGLNDPVYLYGTLHGPYPAANGADSMAIEGQLTVTRADLLDAIVQGAKYAFRNVGAGADIGSTPRIFHMILPGDRDEETLRGAGFIFAYPLLPPDMMLYGAANEVLVSQYLFDILSGIKEDMEKEGIKAPLRKALLPVPSRAALEQELEAQGFQIKGDTAVRKLNTSAGFSGMLQSVFGSNQHDKLSLPPEGSIDDFIQLAEQVMMSLPGWPPERTKLMRRQIKPASGEVRMRAKGTAALKPREIKTPKPMPVHDYRGEFLNATSASTEDTRRNTDGTERPFASPTKLHTHYEPESWVQDFINQHGGEGQTKLTNSKNVPTPPVGSGQKREPSWMSDFSTNDGKPQVFQTNANEEKKKESETKKPAAKPDWMKDFE